MDLKLCYIFTSAGLKSDSVQKKVIAQINGLNACGVKCRGAFFTSDVQVETKYTDHINLIPYPITNKKYFNSIFQKKQLINKVSKYIDKTIGDNEYLYMRYPGVSFELFQFAKKYPDKIISEHQAKEIDEIKSARKEHPLGFNLSQLISYFLYQLWPVFNENKWGGPYSEMLRAKVAVTSEIADYHKKNCKDVWVIPNGIETQNYKVRKAPELKNELKILFLKGTAGLSTWNGLDRLIKSIDSFQSSAINIQLIICGNIIPNEIPERSYIKQTGYLNSGELDQLFSSVHIGFSTLCLFRKNLQEAAVLKAREYFARGLPFVYAYTDPDLNHENAIQNYVMQVPNDDSIIDFHEVVGFAKLVYSDKVHPEKMRAFTEEKLDWKVKMKQLKNLLYNQ